ncbi:MAG: hypothetical protein GY713_02025 [Actinomycetia bacterium]|nr:hypothetical protein [Actinomycetes bacterium]
MQPFAELVDHVDAALGDVPRVCDELAASFYIHLDRLEALWLDADDALVRAGAAHHRVEAARRGLGTAEQHAARATADSVAIDDPALAITEGLAREAVSSVEAARRELATAEADREQVPNEWDLLRDAERRLDNETASRIGEQQLWDLKDPGRLCSIVSGGWDWVSDLDNLHLVLEIAGMVPGLGNVADAIYLLEGDWQNATLSGLALVPGAGLGATTARVADRVDDATDIARNVDRADPATSGARLNAQLVGEEIAGGHAFPANGRAAYWRDGVDVVRNPATRDGSTAFVPDTGYDYFLNLYEHRQREPGGRPVG